MQAITADDEASENVSIPATLMGVEVSKPDPTDGESADQAVVEVIEDASGSTPNAENAEGGAEESVASATS